MIRGPGRLRFWLGGYLALLALSYGWQALPSPTTADIPAIEVEVVENGNRRSRRIDLAFEQWHPSPRVEPAGPTVLLLHGSPGSHLEVRNLALLLSDGYPSLAPDLPGFGSSRASLPDYSIAAHADYSLQLLDALQVDRVHLIGFSMGGGVAIELAERLRGRAESLTLLASIGAQEYELFGDYHLNHAVHGLQWAALWGLHHLAPHFGLLNDFALDVAYARNFYDSDQRPLRARLSSLDLPILILHGESDFLVPVAAAREHHRIAPHSELVLYPHGHFMPFLQPELLAEDLLGFLHRVDEGRAARRSSATSERLAAAARPIDPRTLARAVGPTLLVWMLLLAAATLVSEDLTCIATGLLVAQGRLDLAPGVIACFVGIFVGDMALYLAGRWLGRPWLHRAPLKWVISASRLEESSQWLERRGAVVIFLSRFWPGMRLPTYFVAGLLRTNLARFTGLFALAVAVWTPILVGATAWLGESWLQVLGSARGSIWWLLAAAVVATWMLSTIRRLATHRGRRLWIGTWRRRLQWEFWPPWILYPPVLLWILWLALRHRSATVFTAANPAIPDGGFVGESKSGILDLFPGDAVAAYVLLPTGMDFETRLRATSCFIDEHGFDFPVVIKPDIGQRGEGVTIARNWTEVEAALSSEHSLLVQEYVPGVELGVFYVRRPDEPAGRIFSITRKELPEVHGDGTATLEELILRDERAVILADTYLERLDRSPDDVPDQGESVRLVEIGTHCLGAVFRDGSDLDTDALRLAVDRISRVSEGFYFGRFDLKAPSVSDAMAGLHLRVLELNGVTSEATHIYDPSCRLRVAYRTLFRQWSLAFEIGAANRRRGAATTSFGRLASLAADHLLNRRPGATESRATTST